MQARAFVRGLPRGTGTRTPVLFAAPASGGARLTARAGPGTVPLAGAERLRTLEPLLRFATTVTAYAADAAPGVSVWELRLRDARLVIALSPEVSRGFSGEGGALWDLADDRALDDADVVRALLSFEPRIDVPRLMLEAALSEARVTAALGRLGAAGQVGYDCAAAAYFHRELPYDADALTKMHPRLRDARGLVDAAAVVRVAEPGTFRVDSEESRHLVSRQGDGGYRCTCPWYGKHKGSRGPCKHVLAVEMTVLRG